MNLAQYLVKRAKRFPNKTAVRCGSDTITFRELDIRSNRLADGLRDLGLEPGDRALVVMPASIDRIAVFFALAKAGLVEVPADCAVDPETLSHIVEETSPKIFIGAETHLETVRTVFSARQGPSIRLARGVSTESEFINLESVLSNRPEYPLYAADDDDTVTVLYTGGLRGVMLTHGNFASICSAWSMINGDGDPDTVVLGAVPLCHPYGITGLLNISMYQGQTIELFQEFSAENIVDALEREHRSMLYVLPDMLEPLISATRRRSLRPGSPACCIVAGVLPSPKGWERLHQLFKGEIYDVYGMPEAPLCAAGSSGIASKPGSVGRFVPGCRARVVDDELRDLPSGGTGELLLKGPGVMKGYLNRHEETKRILENGWLHTGDTARVDEEGYLYLVNRASAW
ncbi:MAG: hypothetical protein AVO39_01040 [delta proteobacterium MLS_D]|jgi:long-chain acyl-CoA synthetase|nr:MAG: hypothetical protein AVO39_01040 [delta proteobacterium MLS_D]